MLLEIAMLKSHRSPSSPELLSPAGNCDALRAAVSAGADAVYLGGKHFSARGYADNFTPQQLIEAVDYAHFHGVKFYAAVNTLIKGDEVGRALKFSEHLHDIGVDAIIVHDPGFASILLRELPDMPLHASTQMSVHSTPTALFLEELGFKRVILARELSLQEIASIRQHTHIELEVFVHGALCISYSGHCLLSSMLGGRSGNRGLCAQPCRKKYTLHREDAQVTSEAQHLLSPRDLNASNLLRKLADTGVSCFKIEGRMKGPEYVAGITSAYRSILDNITPLDTAELSKSFNRGFTTGYLTGAPGKLINTCTPKNLGEPIGTTAGRGTPGTLCLELTSPLTTGDGIAIHHGKTITEICVSRIIEQRPRQDTYATVIQAPVDRIPPGSRVYRTHDRRYSRALQRLTPPRQALSIKAILRKNKPARLTLTAQDITITAESRHPAVEARTSPLTQQSVKEQLTKLNNTPFYCEGISVEMDECLFLPLSEINNLRRGAVEQLKKAIVLRHKRAHRATSTPVLTQTNTATHPQLAVRIDSLASLDGAILGGADIIYFGGTVFDANKILKPADYQYAIQQCREHGIRCYLDTPAITKDREATETRRLLKLTQPEGILAANPGTLHITRRLRPQLTIITDHTIPVFNAHTLCFLHQQGVQRATLSPELNREEIQRITPYGSTELIVHGNIPLMTIQHCLLREHLNPPGVRECRVNCTEHYSLEDEKHYTFPLKTDQYCRNYLLNSREPCLLPFIPELTRSGISVLRIEAKGRSRGWVQKTTRAYQEAISENREKPEKKAEDEKCRGPRTAEHYNRGVE